MGQDTMNRVAKAGERSRINTRIAGPFFRCPKNDTLQEIDNGTLKAMLSCLAWMRPRKATRKAFGWG